MGQQPQGPCPSCLHALGWHRCDRAELDEVWRAGAVRAGTLDVASTLWALARRLVPLEVLRQKIQDHIGAWYVEKDDNDGYMETFERMQGIVREYNVHADPHAQSGGDASAHNDTITAAELRA